MVQRMVVPAVLLLSFSLVLFAQTKPFVPPMTPEKWQADIDDARAIRGSRRRIARQGGHGDRERADRWIRDTVLDWITKQ